MKKNRENLLCKGDIVDRVNNFDIIDCELCQFKHIIPFPDEKEIDTIYSKEYYSSEKPTYITRMEEDLDWWNIAYDDRYDSFEKILQKKSGTILDIGSGPGFFFKERF